jgi:hypothetical protein
MQKLADAAYSAGSGPPANAFPQTAKPSHAVSATQGGCIYSQYQ